MLGKLIRHEWKSVSRVGMILLCSLLGVTVLGCIVMQIPSFTSIAEMDSPGATGWMFMSVVSVIMYILILVGLIYGIFIYLGVHFYKSMYSAQGYLTHTLPVKSGQLLFGKTLVAGIWYLIIEAAAMLSMFLLLMLFMVNVFGKEGYGIWETFQLIYRQMHAAYAELGLDLDQFLRSVMLLFILSPFVNIAMLFGAVSLGQLSRKHKAMMGILAYVGVMFVNMIISSIVQTVNTIQTVSSLTMAVDDSYLSYNYSVTSNVNEMMYIACIISGIIGAVMYFAAYQVIDKKLNLE